MKANTDVRDALERSGVKQWELANKLNKGEAWLSKKLRCELTLEEKSEMFIAIAELEQEKQANE